MEQAPFERVLGSQIGNAVRSLGESKGVKFVMERSLAKLEGDAKTGVRAVVLDNGDRIEYVAFTVGVMGHSLLPAHTNTERDTRTHMTKGWR